MDVGERLDLLRTGEAFSRLPEVVLRALAERMIPRRFVADAALMRQGDPPDGLWVIVSGSAEVRLNKRGQSAIVLAKAGPGAVLGEMALVTHAPRNADVVATVDGVALFLSSGDFADMETRLPEVVGVLTELVAQRLGRAAEDGLGDKVLEGYRIVRPVGRGATAVVYESEKLASGERVALKMLSHRLARDRTAMAWFEREATILARLRHPAIAYCRGRFPAYGTRFLVMDFVDGPSLNEILRRLGAMPEPDVRAAIGTVAAALGYVHSCGVVHGDVKPANVLVGRNGWVRLTDFGIAAAIEESDRATRSDALRLSGTPRYMAPEMFLGAHRSRATDLYALGCVLWEALTGHPAFPMDDIGSLVHAKRTFAAPTPSSVRHGLAPDLHHEIVALLDPDPHARSDSAESLAENAGDVSTDLVAKVLAARAAAQ